MTIVLKHRIIRLGIILYLSLLANLIYSQIPYGKYVTSHCEYVHFVNDTLIDFMLIGSHKGAVATTFKGIGTYKIENEHLIVIIGEYPLLYSEMDVDLYCYDFKEKNCGIDKYKIEILSESIIKLTGPIIDDYERLNRKRHFKTFINFPWKWRFKNKQQWYSPRTRELIICSL